VAEAVPGGPDPVLVQAAAMVFVADLSAPGLSEADAHHLHDVLRLRPGESVIASDGRGGWIPCRLDGPPGDRGRRASATAVLEPTGPASTQSRLAPSVTVAFAPTKGDRPEWVVQKLTELGVDRIVPLRTKRSVVRWEGERGERAVERLRRVAKEASAQMEDRLGHRPWLARPGGGRPGLSRPTVAVGPEGGWDDEELARWGSGVGLGPTVLRAETAAVAAGTLLCALRAGVVSALA
jgi:16S rRNA (uracil1498-N3)-methyltransferase